MSASTAPDFRAIAAHVALAEAYLQQKDVGAARAELDGVLVAALLLGVLQRPRYAARP